MKALMMHQSFTTTEMVMLQQMEPGLYRITYSDGKTDGTIEHSSTASWVRAVFEYQNYINQIAKRMQPDLANNVGTILQNPPPGVW